ncbi:MAG: hypothetical protein AABY22_04225 [Nanoarchaeota archaeon]
MSKGDKKQTDKKKCLKCGRKMIAAINWWICEPCWHKVKKV